MSKILVLSTGRGYGGAEKSIELLIKGLAKNNIVTVCVSNERHKKSLENIKDVKIVEVKNTRFLWIYNIIIILNLLKSNDIIILNTNKDAFCFAIICSFFSSKNKSILVYIRDYQWRFKHFIFRFLNGAKYLLPTRAILDDNNIKSLLKNKDFFIVEEPIEVNRDVIYKKGKYILLLANISKWKGITLLIEAYFKSKVYLKGVKLIICGGVIDRFYYKEIIDLINRYRLQDMVIIRDFQDDIIVKDLYKNAYFVVNSSISQYGGPETFGRTIIEAWSEKKAVISFDIGGPKYIIEDKKNGILVEEGSIESLSNAIRLLIKDEIFCQKLGENGYERIRKKNNINFICSRVLDIARKE